MTSLATFSSVIEVLGIIAFAMSGVFAALEKKLDVFGVLVIAFVTSVGGGTLRDVLIGATPVGWLKDTHTLQIILATTVVTLLLRKRIGNVETTLMVFARYDAQSYSPAFPCKRAICNYLYCRRHGLFSAKRCAGC
jgi:uncharacterized membrane protein YeiH